MTPEQIRQAIRKRPFAPFVVHTTSGEKFTVGHPEAIWQARPPEDSTVIIQDKNAGVILTDASCIGDIIFPKKKSSTSRND